MLRMTLLNESSRNQGDKLWCHLWPLVNVPVTLSRNNVELLTKYPGGYAMYVEHEGSITGIITVQKMLHFF